MQLYRVVPIECEIPFTLIDNGLFKYKHYPLRSCPVKEDRSYRTLYGPSIYHTATEYKRSINNTNIAALRLLSSRFQEKPYFSDAERLLIQIREAVYREDQARFCQTGVIRSVITELRRRVNDAFHDFDPDKFFNEYVDMAHIKKELRVNGRERLESTTGRWCGTGVDSQKPFFLARVQGKLKLFEYSKPGKKPRLIVDMTVEGSLIAGAIMCLIKQCFAEPIITHGHGQSARFSFISHPTSDNLDIAFGRLLNPSYDFEYVYYSDDACVYFIKDGVIQRANIDISSCDMSHTPAIFSLFLDMCKGHTLLHEVASRAVSQCTIPMRLGRDTFKPIGPTLYSGSCLTTPINNIANLLIGISIFGMQDIVSGAARAGYKVTVDVVNVDEDYQFLKYSPTRENGYTQVFLNLGVLLRVLGSCRGDLPRGGSMIQRAANYNYSLALAFKHSGNSSFLRALLSVNENRQLVSLNASDRRYYTAELARSEIPDSAYERRYKVPGMAHLAEWIATAGYGDVFRTPYTDAVYLKDYDYSS
jgi:hypothetical protein